jgi:hypothetical protein
MLILFHQPPCLFLRLCGESPNRRTEREVLMYSLLLKFRKFMLVLGRILTGGLILMMEKF